MKTTPCHPAQLACDISKLFPRDLANFEVYPPGIEKKTPPHPQCNVVGGFALMLLVRRGRFDRGRNPDGTTGALPELARASRAGMDTSAEEEEE